MILVVTSMLFATVAMHASYLDAAPYQFIFSAVTVLSMDYHYTHDAYVRIADTVMAHVAMAFVLLWETQKLVMTDNEWLLIFPSAVTLLWVAEEGKQSTWIHAILHVTSVVGLHAYLYYLY